MKRRIKPRTAEQMMREYPMNGLLEGWYFRVDEVSASVFRAEGSDTEGRRVSRTGLDPDELLASCVADAADIRTRVESQKSQGG